MKNDYLWDKTGSDEEIEKLENALKLLRYQPNEAPPLPAKILQIEEKRRFSLFPNLFRFAMAGFACLAIGLISLGIWFNASTHKIKDVPDLSKSIVKPISVEIPVNSSVETTPSLTKVKDNSVKNKPILVSKPIPVKQIQLPKPMNIVYRQKDSIPPETKEHKEVKLTSEEQYAYNQLMLALSITSSKLKEVRDKANGGEETTAEINSLK